MAFRRTLTIDPATCVLRKGITVRLNEGDRTWALTAGVERIRRNIERGTWRRLSDDNGDPVTLERNACGAEIAFARMVGVQPVLIKDEWIGEPNGYLPNGKPYNVQHTGRRDGNLLVACNSHPQQSWIFALCLSQWPDITFRGWIPGELLLRASNVEDVKKNRRGRPSWCFYWSRTGLRDALWYW